MTRVTDWSGALRDLFNTCRDVFNHFRHTQKTHYVMTDGRCRFVLKCSRSWSVSCYSAHKTMCLICQVTLAKLSLKLERQQKRKQWRFLFWFFGLILSLLCWNRSCSYLWYTASLQRQHWWKNDHFSQICNLWVFMPIGFWCCFTWISVDGISKQLLQYNFHPPCHFLPSGVSLSMLFFCFIVISHIINANRATFTGGTTEYRFYRGNVTLYFPPIFGLITTLKGVARPPMAHFSLLTGEKNDNNHIPQVI